ncbi:hypothetical protein JTB14_014763 [Gonioctena quinquepunctata]|nr:hypothetical protein JTB14_014763 [Gonioctena quinquepunctata]
MIFNLPESDGNSTTADQSKVKEIIRDITYNEVQISKTLRIGKTNKNGARALKVILESSLDVSYIRNRNKVKKDRNIFINSDQTPMQMAQFKSLQLELKHRIEQGENDVKLKYINGTPKIIKTRNILTTRTSQHLLSKR